MSRFLTLLGVGLCVSVWLGLSIVSDESGRSLSAGEKAPAKQRAALDLKQISPAAERILAALGEKTETGFVDTPLSEAIGFLSDFHDITIILDEAALTEEGLGTDEPISLDVAGITLRSALRIMLEPLQLTYIVEDEVMKITTKIAADKKRETHVYDVGKLAKAGFDAEELAEVVERTIEGGRPHSGVTSVVFSKDGKTVALKSGEETLQLWDVATGKPKPPLKQVAPAVITALPGCLVVTHTQRGHEQIADLLAQLERLVATANSTAGKDAESSGVAKKRP